MAVSIIGPKFYAWDRNGKPLAFGKLYTYQARSNNPKATFQSEDQVVENTNPVILNGEGYANVYLSGQYKMVLKDKDENEIWSSDPVSENSASEWQNCLLATYLSATSFKVNGNHTSKYDSERKLRVDNNTSTYAYTEVVSASYAAGETTVIVKDPVITTGVVTICTSIVGKDSSFSGDELPEYLGRQVNLREYGGDPDAGDNTDAIIAAYEDIRTTGGVIILDDIYEYSSQIGFDTSIDTWEVIFLGQGTRTTGVRYNGPDSPGDWAMTIGVNGVGSSGFVSFLNCGVYGNGQEINGVRLFKAQRYQRFAAFTVRNFNGMLLECGSGDVFLNTWGSIFLLNGCRACDLGSEFNACNISNIVIENMTYVTSQYDDSVPVAKIDGIGTMINTLSIENCPPDIQLDISNTVTIGILYQENNHGANLGVNARPIVAHGDNPRILSGDIKLPGVNANESGFYVVDLDDSDKADFNFRVRLPTANPTAYQKPILWGTSKRAILNIKWDMFNGIALPSRAENAAFSGETRVNSVVNGVKRIFGQDPELIGRQLMTSYTVNIPEGRVLYPNSNNRAEGYIESNISASSRLENGFGFSERKDVLRISRNLSSGDFGVYKDYTLVSGKKYLFSTIVGRKSVDNARPRMRVTDNLGTQDYYVEPRDINFTGWTQISLVTSLDDASDVRFWPINSLNSTGDNYLAMAFIIDLDQFEDDHGVSFDGMTTKEIEDLINPSYISEEFGRQFRGSLPDSGKWARGERVYKYPPLSGQPEGWVCSVAGDFAGTPPTFLAMANLV